MIEYTDSLSGITEDHLHGFGGGWPSPPSPKTMLKILRGSDYVALAIDSEADRVIGFITALTDGVLSAYISLLEVLPAYQGRGIGSKLVRRVLERFSDLYEVVLLCDRDLQPFYERSGMKPATGMIIRRFQRQSGES